MANVTVRSGLHHQPRKSPLNSFREQIAIQIMVGLGMVWMFVFCYLPFSGLYIAFSDYRVSKPIYEAPFVGLKYFREFVTDSAVPNVLFNTLGLSFLGLTIGFLCPILFALLLNEMAGRRFKRFVQTISYLPHFISWVVLGGMLISWTGEFGLINEVLRNLGLIKTPIYLLGDPKYFWGVSVISNIWKEVGWNAIIYIAAIAGINPELYEVAHIEGANRLQRIRYITLPCIKGTIAILFTLSAAYLLNSNFSQIFVLNNALNTSRSMVLDLYTYRIGIKLGRYSYATAVGLMQSAVALLLWLVSNRISRRLTGESLL